MPPKSRQRSGRDAPAARALRRHLRRVLREQARAVEELSPDTVHDLRVALRRSRSLAEGFAELEPYSSWRRLRKSGKHLQRGLAELRDAQVMLEWVRNLGLDSGPGGTALVRVLDDAERQARRTARAALEDFPLKRWKHWKRRLPARVRELPAGGKHFAAVALQRLERARALDAPCRGSRGRVACHRLRVGLKRFRYTVQSFLPEQQAAWSRDLKRLQDLLGEVHDLDVLRARLLSVAREQSLSREVRTRWLARVDRARDERLDRYEKAISGRAVAGKRRRPQSLWDRWQGELEAILDVNRRGSGGPST